MNCILLLGKLLPFLLFQLLFKRKICARIRRDHENFFSTRTIYLVVTLEYEKHFKPIFANVLYNIRLGQETNKS